MASKTTSETNPETPRDGDARPRLRGWRRWAFPLAAAVLIPLLFLLGLELALGLFGYGVPGDFFLKAPAVEAVDGAGDAGAGDAGTEGQAWITNPRFGERFFPPALARNPVITRVARDKPEGTVRLVVLGGSAALGTPEASLGFGRILERMLEDAYPEKDFEVVIAAMTAINSHIVLPIAEESLEKLDPDALLVYLGNNEVVGPWGPGTVFQGFAESRAAIRWSVWLSGTRTGQLIRNLAGSFGESREILEWRGLEMFADRRIRQDDPRLDTVYDHLRANLEDLAAAAEQAGVPVLLSTVAVNLTDNPPFASEHRPGLDETQLAGFRELYDSAVERLEAAGDRPDVEAALVDLQAAAEVDDGYADLQFYLAHAHKLLEDEDRAVEHWRRALDSDALRFRADSTIRGILAEVAQARADRGVHPVDGAAAVAAQGPPGNEVFWEHVHLNLDGNYRLAEAFFAAVATLPVLDGGGGDAGDTGTVPTVLERPTVARQLAITAWDQWRMARAIARMTDRPPFTGQLGHRQVRTQRRMLAAELRVAARSQMESNEQIYRGALEQFPNDLLLRARFAELLQERGKMEEALAQWDRLLTRVPDATPWRTSRAFTLAGLVQQAGRDEGGAEGEAEGEAVSDTATVGDTATVDDTATPGDTSADETGEAPSRDPRAREAVEVMEAVLAENRRSPEAWINLGSLLEELEDRQRAEEVYRDALERFPTYQPLYFNLATLLARNDRLKEAEGVYRDALEVVASAEIRGRLGEILELQEEVEAAEEAYRQALEMDQDLAETHNNLGFLLERQGRLQDAVASYRQALEADPTLPLPYFNLGDLLLQAGQASRAAMAYSRGLALEPVNLQARYNLGVALAAAGEEARALEELERLLTVAPSHPGALNNVAWLLATASDPELRNPQRAVEMAERVRSLAPANPQVLETLARAYAAAGRRADARRTAREAVAAAGDQAQAGSGQSIEERLKDLL